MSMTSEHNFNSNLKKFAKVLRKNKYLVISVLKKNILFTKISFNINIDIKKSAIKR